MAKGKDVKKPDSRQVADKPEEKAKCLERSCKKKEDRFGFCSEHYEFFKFGLIKKDGAPAADFDKKYQHWLAHKDKILRKVA